MEKVIKDGCIHEISDDNNQLEEVIQNDCIQETDDNIQLEEVIQDECIQETRHDNGNME